MERRGESSAQVAGPSAPGHDVIDPAPDDAVDERAARRQALRSLAAMIGEEVFY